MTTEKPQNLTATSGQILLLLYFGILADWEYIPHRKHDYCPKIINDLLAFC
jgi:hypothetical protein